MTEKITLNDEVLNCIRYYFAEIESKNNDVILTISFAETTDTTRADKLKNEMINACYK